jgi:hypothetical protein
MPFFGVPIRNGLPIGLGSVAGFGVQQFDPSELFVGGTVAGAWYDPSDLSTMFDTSAGTTPVAMPGLGSAVSVGLMLDKSQGLVLGSELVVGSASAYTGNGTVSTVGDTVTATCTTNGVYGIRWASSNISNIWTRCVFEVVTNSASKSLNFYPNLVHPGVTVGTTTGGKTYTLLAPTASGGNQVPVFFINGLVGESFSIRATSIRELPGNHAISFNNTTARPELRARVNLLVATATLSTQSVTTQATSYTLRFAGTGSITLSGTATGSYSAGTHTITCTAGTLTLTVSGTVTTADLRPANSGALLPAYQAVVDANTYDTSGFPLYLFFDGIDDSMYTPANLNLSGTDKVAVFAGVRKLSDAAQGVVAELSATIASNNGTFLLAAPDGATQTYGWDSKGTTQVDAVASSLAAPRTNVLVGTADIAGDSCIIRVNGAVADTEAGDQGTGNYGTYPLFIGARNNSSLRFNGHLHSLIIAGSAVSAGNISATEQWVAGKTGITI